MTDLQIARKTTLKPISQIAEKLGINVDNIEMYGKYKAKLPLSLINRSQVDKSHLILYQQFHQHQLVKVKQQFPLA